MATRVRLLAVVAGALLVVPGVAHPQAVLLQIRPHAGDTLALKLDQKVEMTGVPEGCSTGYSSMQKEADAEPQPRSCVDGTRQMTTRTEVFSRAIIQGTSGEVTHVLALTDSIRTSVGAESARGRRQPARRGIGSIELRVSRDGGARVVDGDASAELRTLFGQMPATLSRGPVSVGDQWTREMRIPLSTYAGGQGTVRARFRLDSLGPNGDIAYISMQGTLRPDDDADSNVEGWIAGTMQLDRRIAWITHTRAVIDVQSTVRPAAGGAVMRVRTRITQILRAARAQ